MQNPELSAAYDRIDELKTALSKVRSTLRDGTDPFDIIDESIEHIDRALSETVLA